MDWFSDSSEEVRVENFKEQRNQNTAEASSVASVDVYDLMLYGLIVALVLAYIILSWFKFNRREQKRLQAELEIVKVAKRIPSF